MSRFLKVLRWAVIVYVAAWVAPFFVEVYSTATRLRFLVPTVFSFLFTLSVILPSGRAMSRRKTWIVVGFGMTALNARISRDFWNLYLVQNDAPMGLIPDINALFCLAVDFLLLGLVFGPVSLIGGMRKGPKKTAARREAGDGVD